MSVRVVTYRLEVTEMTSHEDSLDSKRKMGEFLVATEQTSRCSFNGDKLATSQASGNPFQLTVAL